MQERLPNIEDHRAVRLLQELLRFDTSNPPGNEAPCVGFIDQELRRAGLKTHIVSKDPARPNLVARLPGRGEAPALLLAGHLDVVPADPSSWRHPPFSGTIDEGCLWGRGALDMKGGVAMMLAAFLQACNEGLRPAGDLLFAALADEEAGGRLGAQFLVEEHPSLLAGVRYAIGEFGAFPLRFGGRTFYPVQVDEKTPCLATITVSGAGGHGARISRGGTMARLAAVVRRLDRHRFPVRVPDATRRMILSMAAALPWQLGAALRGLLVPPIAGALLRVLGRHVRPLEPLLRDTATPTIVRAGKVGNVVPRQATLIADCRLLPGTPPHAFLDRLRGAVGKGARVELECFGAAPVEVDWGLYPLLAEILNERTTGGGAVPLLLPASTDARFFNRLGIQTYGFLPMDLPPGFPFLEMIHAANERVPLHCLAFGASCILDLLRRYPSGTTPEGSGGKRRRR